MNGVLGFDIISVWGTAKGFRGGEKNHPLLSLCGPTPWFPIFPAASSTPTSGYLTILSLCCWSLSKYLLKASLGSSMASAIRLVKYMEIPPIRFMYSVKTGRKLGSTSGDGHWFGASRLLYRGASGPGVGCSVEMSICSRLSMAPAVISAERRE